MNALEETLKKKGYIDLVGNLPEQHLQAELKTLKGYREMSDYVITIRDGKADIYIPLAHFTRKRVGRKNGFCGSSSSVYERGGKE